MDGIFNLRAAMAMRERGHDVAVARIAPHIPPWNKRWQRYRTVPARYVVDGVPVRTLWGLMGPKRWAIGTLALQLRAAIDAQIEAFAPDVVHVQGLLPAGVLALGARRPFVVTAHGSETYALVWRRRGLQSLARHVIERAGALAAVSGFVAANLDRLGARTVRVIYNGADEMIFEPRSRAASRARLHVSADRPVLAFAANVVREKGVFELLDALERLTPMAPVLLVAGAGEAQEAVSQRARARGLDVRMFGRLDQPELADVLAACDTFVLPSYAEGLPAAICEAMMMGRAVVASAVGGIPEILASGRGMVVPSKDPPALAFALRSILEDAALRRECEQRARTFAVEHLTWRRNALAYETLYQEVLTGTR